jgi:hypothetical protein
MKEKVRPPEAGAQPRREPFGMSHAGQLFVGQTGSFCTTEILKPSIDFLKDIRH